MAALCGLALVIFAVSRLGESTDDAAVLAISSDATRTHEAKPIPSSALDLGQLPAQPAREPLAATGSTWKGRVVDQLERPIAGATVRLMNGEEGDLLVRLSTVTAGIFRVPAHREASLLRVSAPGFLDADWPLRGLSPDAPLSIVLVAARSFQGTLLASGPLESTVEIRTLETSPAIRPRRWTLQEAGPFRIADAPAGILNCIASADGFAPVLFQVPADPGPSVSIALQRGQGSGIAVHASGEPFESVQVALARTSMIDGLARTVAFAKGPGDGALVFKGLPEARFEVTVTSERTRGWQQSAIVQTRPGEQSRVEFDFRPSDDFVAQLVDDRDSSALSSVNLQVRDPRGGIEAIRTSGPDGVFQLPATGQGVVIEITSLDGNWILVDGTRWGAVELTAQSGEGPLRVRARPSRILRGAVTRNGAPALEPARVQIFRGVPRDGSALATIAAIGGRFELQVPENATGRHVILARSGDAQGILEVDITDVPADLPPIELVLYGSIFGLVRAGDETAQSLDRVKLRRADPTSGHPLGWGDHVAPLDATNAFRCQQLPAGTYLVETGPLRCTPRLVELLPGASYGPLELAHEASTAGRLAGWVVDSDGAPAPGARVSAVAISTGGRSGEFRAARADREGRFSIEVDAPGQFQLSAMVLASIGQMPARSPAPLTVSSGTEDARLVVEQPPTATVAGRFPGLEDVPVTFRASNGTESAMHSLQGGPFEAQGIPTGVCELHFSAPGRSTRTLEVAITPGERLDLGDLHLAALRAVQVQVFDSASVPFPEAEIFALPVDGPLCVPPSREYSIGRTDGSGLLRVAALDEIPLQLVAWAPGFVPALTEVLPEEEAPKRDLVLRRAVTLRVEGIQQALAETLFWSVSLTEEGAADPVRQQGVNRLAPWTELRDIAPGRYALEIQPTVAPEILGWRVNLELEPGGDTAILLHLDGQRFDPSGGPR